MKKYILPALIFLGAAFIVTLIFKNRQPAALTTPEVVKLEPVPQPTVPIVKAELLPPLPEVETGQREERAVVSDEPPSIEVLRTRSMVVAHAPLREPSVMDPDSKENQIILQTMITKVLGTAPLQAEYVNQKPLD